MEQQQVKIDLNLVKLELGERDLIIMTIRSELQKAMEELAALKNQKSDCNPA